MATIYVDNTAYQVDGSRNLLDVCLTLGFKLPFFCWHPAMGSVGACRQCAVKQFKNEEDTRGRLVMACMTPSSEGTRISIADEEAVRFRRMVIEGLMLNHPHDCPVCDEGGECHLQDMTVMTGHDYRRYRFKKRTYRNQYLGPFVNHEMNRCIQCYRCVRFYREYAGGHDLNSFVLHNTVYFGRHEDGKLENEFSGNLVEVCPTGVFTDATLKQHYTRKWDLQFAPSICVHCGAGCNTSPGERYGALRRIVNRYNDEVNGYFLCDRGRYSYEFVNSPKRIHQARWRGQAITKEAAVEQFGRIISGSRRVIGIGSPRASLEANFALRALVGAENFFAGIAPAERTLVDLMLRLLRTTPARPASLHDIETTDAALVLGEDVLNTAPRIALALRQSVRQQPFAIAEKLHVPLWMDHSVRQAVQDARGPLYVAAVGETRIDDIAAEIFRGAPDDIARLGFAVAQALDASAPAVPEAAESMQSLAGRIAAALKGAKRPAVVSGPSLGSESVILAAAGVAQALAAAGMEARLGFAAPEANSFGLAMMDPGRLEDAVAAGADTVIVLENDLDRRLPPGDLDRLFRAAENLVALDSLENCTVARAGLVLPAGTFAESDGTLVNNEGRAQRYFQVFVPEGEIQESWRWLRDGMVAAGRGEFALWQGLDAVTAAVAEAIPALARITEAAPPEMFRLAGEKIPRKPHRYSGRTAMLANISVHEPKPPDDPDSPLSFSMEGYPGQPPAAVTPFFWAPSWNSIQSLTRFQEEINGPLRGGPAGVRLIEPEPQSAAAPPGEAPRAFAPRRGELLVVPRHHIFGSDELGMQAPAIAGLAPPPYLAMNDADAGRLGAKAGDPVTVQFEGASFALPVRIEPTLPAGVAAAPFASVAAALPAWARITRQ